MRHNRIKSLALLVLFVLCAALGAAPAFAVAESATVQIPIYATGLDCHAVLRDKDDAIVQTVTVPKDGSANFSVFCEGLGRHEFTLALSDTDSATESYDKTVYTIRVELFYNAAATEVLYTVEAIRPQNIPVVIPGGGAKVAKLEFRNKAICIADPPVRKVIKGTPPVNSTFTFEMRAGNAANPMPPGSSGGVKQISILGEGVEDFGDMVYTAPGTYHYTIKELAGDAAGFTYDTTIYDMRVTVSDTGGGKLAVSYKFYVNNQLVNLPEAQFTNTYDPKGKGPKTGDERNAALWLGLGGVSLAAILVVLFFLKRRRKDEQPPEADTRPKD